MRIVFQNLHIRFRAPVLRLGEVHNWDWVDAELVIVAIGLNRCKDIFAKLPKELLSFDLPCRFACYYIS